MHRLTAILLLLTFSLIATGAPLYLHQLEHEHEHAALLLAQSHPTNPTSPTDPAHHSDSDDNDTPCLLCAQLHSPLFLEPPFIVLLDAAGWVPYVSMLAIDQQSQTSPARILCRGPPPISSV